MTPRSDGEALARELTLGALSYADLARRAWMVAERFFPRGLRSLEVAVLDPDQADLLHVFSCGEGTEVQSALRGVDGRDVAAFAARLAEPLLMGPDLSAECRERDILPPAIPSPSLLVIPLVREGKRLGALILGLELLPGTEITRRWSDLNGVAQVLAAALQSCREHERALAEREQLERIAQVSTRFHLLSSFEEACALAVRLLVEEFEFDRSLLFLPSNDRRALVGVVSVGYEDIGPLIHLSLDPASDVVAEAFSSGSPWLARRAGEDRRVPVVLRESGEIHEAVALPLRVGGESLGVLWADHRRAQPSPMSHRLTLLSLFAAQAAAALANSRLMRTIETLSETDSLTGVANRRSLEGVLRREIPRLRRNQNALTLLMIHVVGLKELNQQFGREAGDQVLRDVAQLLAGTLRETDLVARFGADEFAILMPDTKEAEGAYGRERIVAALDRLSASRPASAPRIHLAFSIRTVDAATAPSLLADADQRFFEPREENLRARLLEALVADRRDPSIRWSPLHRAALHLLRRKEPYSFHHSRRVMQLSLALGRLVRLSESDSVALGLAALLHDIGKISIPADLLARPGPLTPAELALVRTHCARGDDLLRGDAFLVPVRALIRSHHERFDGRTDCPYPAYPDCLAGSECPVGARILKIADVYDAVTSGRPYQAARTPAAALDLIREEKGKGLDPDLVDLFADYLRSRLTDTTPHPVPIPDRGA